MQAHYSKWIIAREGSFAKADGATIAKQAWDGDGAKKSPVDFLSTGHLFI